VTSVVVFMFIVYVLFKSLKKFLLLSTIEKTVIFRIIIIRCRYFVNGMMLSMYRRASLMPRAVFRLQLPRPLIVQSNLSTVVPVRSLPSLN